MSGGTTRISLLHRLKEPRAEEAWREFDAIYRPMLSRFAQARGLAAGEAEDVVQHCMMTISQHIRSFEYDPGKGRFKSWLCTMVNNHVRNLRRAKRDLAAESDDFDIAQQREQLPDEAFETVWMEEHLRHAMRLVQAEVPAESYAAFHKHAIEELSIAEVCAEYGLTPRQLYKLTWQIRQKLQTKLSEYLE